MHLLFNSINLDGTGVRALDILNVIEASGMTNDDPRLMSCIKALNKVPRSKIMLFKVDFTHSDQHHPHPPSQCAFPSWAY